MNNRKVIIIGIDGGTLMLSVRWLDAEVSFQCCRPLWKRGMGRPGIHNPTGYRARMGFHDDRGKSVNTAYSFFLDNLHNNTRNGGHWGGRYKIPPVVYPEQGKEKGDFVNVPFTYPPMEVNGIVISGMFVPNSAKVVSYPPDVYTIW